jgi:hypothetical protein
MKRWIALFLALVFLILCCSCAADTVDVMQYGKSRITANMYRYWLSSYKGTFLYTYSDMTDSDAFWSSILYDDVTAEEYLNEAVQENVKRTLVCMELFRENGLRLPASAEDEIDAYIDDLIRERGGGSKNVFNQELAKLGINTDMLRDIYRYEKQASLLFQTLYAKGGARALSEEQFETYCLENYVRVRHIYINDAYVYETDDSGNYRYNDDGTLMMRELTAAEAETKAATVAKIEADLAAGRDAEEVYKEYSEDTFYKNGYYLTRETNFIPEVVDAAFTLRVGESVKVESDYGTHFLIRMEMDPAPYKNAENADFFSTFESDAKNADFRGYLDTLLPEVEINREEIDKYSIRDAEINYSI